LEGRWQFDNAKGQSTLGSEEVMKSSSAALLACLMTAALLVLTDAAIQEVGGGRPQRDAVSARQPRCTHRFAHDAPAVVNDAIRCAEIAFNRQMTQFERALMIVSGVPPHALH
jgi:hypothetical protein